MIGAATNMIADDSRGRGSAGRTVAAGYARGLVDFAAARGASRETLLERAGVGPAALASQDARIPFARYVALMRAARELTGDDALALHYGEEDMAQMSVVGLLVHASATMAEAVVQMNRFGRLIVEVDGAAGDRFVLARDRAGLWLVDTRDAADDFPELTESTFARMVSGTRRIGGAPFVRAVHVTHAAPPWRAEYDRVFGVPTSFASGRNAMLVDEAWLSARVALSPHYLLGILSAHAEALLRRLEASRSTRGRVEALLTGSLHAGALGMEALAARLGMSRQTLYRRLKAEGATYASVLDTLRRELALHYLAGRKVSVSETAYLLGFSDPAAFSRAFKRWTGKSPRAARR